MFSNSEVSVFGRRLGLFNSAGDVSPHGRGALGALAMELGLEPAYRRAQLWRDFKAHIQELADNKQLLLVWIIDEAHNLPPEFFRDLPAFLNFAFDSRES